MTTTNLSILTAGFNSAGQLICTVNSCLPLYIKELIIVPYPNLPTPIGVLKPIGTPSNGAVHEIFVDSQDPVFSTPAPFTLALTYDGNYRLTAPVTVLATAVVQAAMVAFSLLPALSANDAAVYVTQAVAAIAAQVENQLDGGDGAIAPDVRARAQQSKAQLRKNGHDEHRR